MGPRVCARGMYPVAFGAQATIVKLQWGREFVLAECHLLIHSIDSLQLASMGPRVCARGMLDVLEHTRQ